MARKIQRDGLKLTTIARRRLEILSDGCDSRDLASLENVYIQNVRKPLQRAARKNDCNSIGQLLYKFGYELGHREHEGQVQSARDGGYARGYQDGALEQMKLFGIELRRVLDQIESRTGGQ